MRRARVVIAPLSAASALVLAGCTPIMAPGPMSSEERDVDAVTTVVLDTPGNLAVSEGEPSLVIHASEGVLDRLTSEVQDDTLVLGGDPGTFMGLNQVRYDLTLPDLERIELNGSGDVDATVSSTDTVRLDIDGSGDVEWTRLDADSVEIRLAGSGDVRLVGTTSELAIELDGSGDIRAEDLQAKDATVFVAGSGDVSVFASEQLTVDVSGSGSVAYSGDPQVVDTNVSGSGEVTRR